MCEKTEKAARIAELEREIAELEAANQATPTWGAAVGARWESIKGLRAELARLRNEQPGDTAPNREIIQGEVGKEFGARADDPKAIWLSPNCGGADCSSERTWCEDSRGTCDECGRPETKYIRADLAPALTQGEGSEPVGRTAPVGNAIWRDGTWIEILHEHLETYECRDPDHTLNDFEYLMMEDFGLSLLEKLPPMNASPPPLPEEDDGDGTTRKDVESWMAYFDAHAEEFVAAHEAIIRKATSLPAGNADVDATGEDRCVSTGPFDGTTPANADGLILNQTGNESRNDALNVPRLLSGRDYATMLARLVRRIEKGPPLEGTLNQARGLIARGSDEFFSPLRESPAGNADPVQWDLAALHDLAVEKYKIAREVYSSDHDTALLTVVDELLYKLRGSDFPSSSGNADPRVREALEKVRQSIVLAIAFLNRDHGTDRAAKTVPQIVKGLADADETLRALPSPQSQGRASDRSA